MDEYSEAKIMIKAILYDLDGVLIDACELHRLSFNMALMAAAGFELGRAEHDTMFNGLPTMKKIDILVEQGRLPDGKRAEVWQKKQDLTIKAIEENCSPNGDKITLHQWTYCKGVQTVCVTNSITLTATLMLEKTGQLPYMQFIVTNEMISHPKPHPEGYIYAMVRLGVYPSECLIVEDSEKGLQAARATGARVCQVAGPHDVCEKVRKAISEDIS